MLRFLFSLVPAEGAIHACTRIRLCCNFLTLSCQIFLAVRVSIVLERRHLISSINDRDLRSATKGDSIRRKHYYLGSLHVPDLEILVSVHSEVAALSLRRELQHTKGWQYSRELDLHRPKITFASMLK